MVFVHVDGREEHAKTVARDSGAAKEQAGRDGGVSYKNESEAKRAILVLKDLLRCNPDLTSVAVLTPYNGQVRRM